MTLAEPTIRFEESAVPGRTYDLDVYADNIRLGSIRPVSDRGFIGWKWHFGAALADPALELGRACERADGSSRNQWEAELISWATFLTEAEWEDTQTVVYTEEIANTLHVHALYTYKLLDRMRKMKPQSTAAVEALAVLTRHHRELNDAVAAIGVPAPGESWHPMPGV